MASAYENRVEIGYLKTYGTSDTDMTRDMRYEI